MSNLDDRENENDKPTDLRRFQFEGCGLHRDSGELFGSGKARRARDSHGPVRWRSPDRLGGGLHVLPRSGDGNQIWFNELSGLGTGVASRPASGRAQPLLDAAAADEEAARHSAGTAHDAPRPEQCDLTLSHDVSETLQPDSPRPQSACRTRGSSLVSEVQCGHRLKTHSPGRQKLANRKVNARLENDRSNQRYFRYGNAEYSLAGISEGELFEISLLDIEPTATCTACWPGYQAVFAVVQSRLLLETLHVNLMRQGEGMQRWQRRTRAGHQWGNSLASKRRTRLLQ